VISNWWQHKADADGKRRELYREMEREQMARQYAGPASLLVEHWTMELWVGAAGLSAGVFLLVMLL
jgi:hypothetical protein